VGGPHRFGRRIFHSAHHSEYILSGKTAEIVAAPVSRHKFFDQRRIPADVFEPVWQMWGAVEVAADADVVDACRVAGVLDMVGDIAYGRARFRMLEEPRRHRILRASGRPPRCTLGQTVIVSLFGRCI
jgi:hypothetical protein